MKKIFDSIVEERNAQILKYGGNKHDDAHNYNDWICYIVKHTGRAVISHWSKKQFRKQMIIVASLAVAAIQWCDRLEKDK